jgi:aliphatic nitrilase
MPDQYPIIKVAAAQVAPIYMNREATVEKACRLIQEAAENGAKIVAFPENYVAGYPYFYWTLLTNPFLDQGKWFREIFKNSVEVPSPATEKLCQAARNSNIYAVVGMNERDPLSMGTLYNSQLFIDNRGNIMGVHRKLAPTLTEKMVFARGDGSHLQVFKTDWGEMGGLICGEHANSLAKFSLIARGEKIHIASWAAFPPKIFPEHQKESVLFRIRQHAHEGKLFIISSSGHFSQEMIDILCNTEDEKARIQVGGGCSAIIGVNGEFLAGPLVDQEGILYAEINLEDIIEAKLTHDLLGHYSRFDVLSLNFNDEKLVPIHYVRNKSSKGNGLEEVVENLKEKVDKIEQTLNSFLVKNMTPGSEEAEDTK